MKLTRVQEVFSALYSKRYLRRSILVSAIGLLLVWLAFFDSHSMVKRLSWHREATALAQQNDALRLEIEELERQLNTDLSDEVIEQLARERYGMRREGETVYKIDDIQ